jgi:hypothetical protein
MLAALPSLAKDGRDFAGFYDLANVTDLGDSVQASFSVRVFNYSEADVSGATLTLQDSLSPEQSYGAFHAVSIGQGQSVWLADLIITVPHSEYERWQQGAPPSLRIDFVAAGGNAISPMVELSRLLSEGEV